jgi:hypothetical protein
MIEWIWKQIAGIRQMRLQAHYENQLETLESLREDEQMFLLLLELAYKKTESYVALKEWLEHQVNETIRMEKFNKDRGRYNLAGQQCDFRSALQRVQSKINLLERRKSNESP